MSSTIVFVCSNIAFFLLFTFVSSLIDRSSGQKARVGLARAVYADADIYLLDDPLSGKSMNIIY